MAFLALLLVCAVRVFAAVKATPRTQVAEGCNAILETGIVEVVNGTVPYAISGCVGTPVPSEGFVPSRTLWVQEKRQAGLCTVPNSATEVCVSGHPCQNVACILPIQEGEDRAFCFQAYQPMQSQPGTFFVPPHGQATFFPGGICQVVFVNMSPSQTTEYSFAEIGSNAYAVVDQCRFFGPFQSGAGAGVCGDGQFYSLQVSTPA